MERRERIRTARRCTCVRAAAPGNSTRLVRARVIALSSGRFYRRGEVACLKQCGASRARAAERIVSFVPSPSGRGLSASDAREASSNAAREEPAVDDDRFAGRVTRRWGDEVDRRADEFVGVAEAIERGVGAQPLAALRAFDQ